MNEPSPEPATYVVVPAARLSREALLSLVEEFVTREGTDYGTEEHSLEQKKNAVLRQLDRGEIAIVFDPESESCNLLPKDTAK